MTSNSIAENLERWDQTYDWRQDGDEWQGQAIHCGVPYEQWKRSLIDHLIDPYAPIGSTILEIAPGHGRWSGALAARARKLYLVDLSPACLAHCSRRFADSRNIEYRQGDGSSLPSDLTGQIDLVWSYDSMVHIAPDDIESYLAHIYRVLKPGGMSVIHHANRFHSTLWVAPIRKFGSVFTSFYRLISLGIGERSDGWRSPVSARLFANLTQKAGLEIIDQFVHWGDGSCGVPRFNDRITVMRKPMEELD